MFKYLDFCHIKYTGAPIYERSITYVFVFFSVIGDCAIVHIQQVQGGTCVPLSIHVGAPDVDVLEDIALATPLKWFKKTVDSQLS